MVSKRWLGNGLLCCALLSSVAARAQPNAGQKESARALMAEGRALREQGDLDGALKRFSSADSIMNVPTTGFEVASTQAQLGYLVEARETLRRVLASTPSPDDPEPFNEARSKARTLDQQLLARIGSLRFAVSGVASGTALEITLDGAALPKSALTQPRPVNPGHHVIVARAAGRELKREVDAGETETTTVDLSFPRDAQADAPSDAAPSPASARDAPPTPHEHAPKTGLPTLAYVGFGVGAAGILVGGVTGISAISHKSAAKKGCVDGSCPPSTWSDLDTAHSMATTSTVGFVVGFIGVAAGVGAILLGDEAKPSEHAVLVSPDVGPQGARLTVAGRF